MSERQNIFHFNMRKGPDTLNIWHDLHSESRVTNIHQYLVVLFSDGSLTLVRWGLSYSSLYLIQEECENNRESQMQASL